MTRRSMLTHRSTPSIGAVTSGAATARNASTLENSLATSAAAPVGAAAYARIGLDARLTRRMSVGMQRYAQELANRLPRIARDLQFVEYTRGENFMLDEQVRLPLALARTDVVHHLSCYAPLMRLRPTIVTIHDLIHLRYPEHFKSAIGPYYRIAVRSLVRSAACVITDDEKTIADLEKFLGVDPKRVRVIPLGVDFPFLGEVQPTQRSAPYLFYAGNHRAHKDLRTLVAAWAALPPEIPYDLIMTGTDDLDAKWPRHRVNGARIHCVGDVSDDALAELFAGAAALVYPSLCEGFGLPMLEAAAVGTRVIASDAAIPQVLREHAQVFPATDVPALTALLVNLAAQAPEESAARRAYARGFTWDRCAERTADVYREVVERIRARA